MRGALIGAALCGFIGAIGCLVGFQLQTTKTYDIWTHTLNGAITGAFIGGLLGTVVGSLIKAYKSKRAK
jgi:hypothetical protein